jgi:hypothetical protein
VLRRAAQALAAAGALGLAQPAAAQPIVPPGAEGRMAAPAPADASRDRAEEMRIELVLLADATTFSYGFSARALDATVEVRGFAPNDAIKAKALEIAGRSRTSSATRRFCWCRHWAKRPTTSTSTPRPRVRSR